MKKERDILLGDNVSNCDGRHDKRLIIEWTIIVM